MIRTFGRVCWNQTMRHSLVKTWNILATTICCLLSLGWDWIIHQLSHEFLSRRQLNHQLGSDWSIPGHVTQMLSSDWSMVVSSAWSVSKTSGKNKCPCFRHRALSSERAWSTAKTWASPMPPATRTETFPLNHTHGQRQNHSMFFTTSYKKNFFPSKHRQH